MNPKRIEYSEHAAARLRQRKITRQDVRWLLARGIRTKEWSRGGTQYWGARGYLGKWEAQVIFLEDATRQLIVTVQWLGDAGDEVY